MTVRLAGRQLCSASPITFTRRGEPVPSWKKWVGIGSPGIAFGGMTLTTPVSTAKLFSAASGNYGLVTSSVDMAATLALQITRFAEEKRPVATPRAERQARHE